MLRKETICSAPPPAAVIITDPVDIIAHIMVDHEGAVTRDLLRTATNLTSGEISRYEDAARDRAVELRRARETRS